MESDYTTFIVYPVLIDTAAFYGANAILDKSLSSDARIDIGKTIIFAIADASVRYRAAYMVKNPQTASYPLMDNVIIALTSLGLSTVYDLAKGKNLGSALKKNLLYNSVGLGTNFLIDRFVLGNGILDKSYR